MPVEFDKKAGRYRGSNGQFLSAKDVHATIEKATPIMEKDLRQIARDLNAGKINLAEWQIRMAETIRSAHVFTASVGKGGRQQMSASDWGKVGSKIRDQYKFLNGFARDVEVGRLSPAQIEYRASLYSKAPRSNYYKNEKDVKKAAGFRFARRVIHATESCAECVSWAAKGWVVIDKTPPIGTLICKSFCKCEIEYAMEMLAGR